MSFDSSTSVLHFPLPRRDSTSYRLLLWPALGWQVVAPRGRTRKLNVLQKAVLGLSRTSSPGIDRMAARLHLGQDLVAFIVTELGQLGWIDASGKISSAGVKVLEAEQSEPSDEQTVGWVFSDPFTGDVWPRFLAGDLPYAETETDEQGHLQLAGSRGEGRGLRVFNVRPRNSDIIEKKPRSEDVVRASRSHRRQYGWETELVAEDAPAVRRVSHLSDRATPFFLVIRAWRDTRAEWHVDDPFGIGESLRLRGQIEERLDAFPGLRSWLGPVVGGDVADNDIGSLQTRAQYDVQERLSVAIQRWPYVEERLVAMQRARLEVEVEASPLDKWDDVGVKAQKAVERIFLEVTQRWPPRTRLSRHDFVANEALLAQIARDLGFTDPLPQTLLRVKTGKIHAAMSGDSGGLRPLALLALLGTPGCPDHPYARAAKAVPDLLHQIDALARARNEAGHEFRRARRIPEERRQFQDAIDAGVQAAFTAAQYLLL